MALDDDGRQFPNRATAWKLRTRTLRFGQRPLVMGILNVTPDSFSDGGKFLDHDRAIAHGLKLLAEGADLLDIGGESTRPYATPVAAEEELRRVLPVIAGIAAARPASLISVDTSKAKVARAAIEAGAEIVNDVSALGADRRLKHVIRDTGAAVVLMHMQGTPQTMQENPQYADVVAEVLDFLRARRDQVNEFGVEPARICLDPGIGFGKTHEHNIALMANCWRLHALGCPLLVGHSRKAFLGGLIGDKQADRTAATIGGSLALAAGGVQMLRVHDVRPTRDALAAFVACRGPQAGA